MHYIQCIHNSSVETAYLFNAYTCSQEAGSSADRSRESEKQNLIPDTRNIFKSHFTLFPPPTSSALSHYICNISNPLTVDFFFRT